MQAIFLVFLFIVGTCFGSFLCCQARRLRLRETTSAKSKKPQLGSRSVCLHCKHQLKWYDNLPLISWLTLGGKCRYCHAKIGFSEFLSELSLGLAFLGVGHTYAYLIISPSTDVFAWLSFIFTLLLILSLGFLAIYDGLYGELPSLCLTISIIFATIVAILKQWSLFSNSSFSPSLILDPICSVAILGGVYLVLYVVSHGEWVGDGDWLLGLALGLALSNPWLALITLFLANALACVTTGILAVKPHRSTKLHRNRSTKFRSTKSQDIEIKTTSFHLTKAYFFKLDGSTHIHLGPFLVVAFVIVYIWADFFCKYQPSML